MRNWKKWTSLFLILLLALGLAACGGDKTGSSEEEATSIPAGTFEGEGQGLGGPIRVAVTTDGQGITKVEVLEHNETEGIADPALETIPQAVVDKQSVDVEVVAGATMTSQGILDGVKDALEKAGIDLSLLAAGETSPTGSGEAIEKEADVIIIGGGGAGMAAATSALQEGATVLVLEKMPAVGGSTIMAGGQYNAVDDKRQHKFEMRPELIEEIRSYTLDEPVNEDHAELMRELAEELEEYIEEGHTYVFDSPELHALQSFRGGDQVANIKLVEELTEGAEDSIEWLEELGVEFQDNVATVTGALWQRTHQFVKPLVTGPLDAYKDYIASKGDKAEIMLNTKAEKLIVEDGRVVGVEAMQGDSPVIARAKKGVIIATGGFARNEELVLKYDTHWGNLKGLNSTNSVSATGDGIIMAQEVGANLVGMEWIQLLPVGDPETGGMQGNISINAANQLFVNEKGERFVAEDERRDVLTQGLMEQPERVMYILHDAHEYYDETVKNDFNEEIGMLVETGVVIKGETIEELAENMGVDPAVLVDTVETYNKAVRGEIQDPFGKKLLQDEFNKGPFYASKRVPTIHHTMGGVEITEDAQVLDTNGRVIPGLYAAGEVTGGIHGANRLGGNAIPDTVVFGRIAGESAAEGK